MIFQKCVLFNTDSTYSQLLLVHSTLIIFLLQMKLPTLLSVTTTPPPSFSTCVFLTSPFSIIFQKYLFFYPDFAKFSLIHEIANLALCNHYLPPNSLSICFSNLPLSMIFQKLLFKIDSRNIGLGILKLFAMELLTYFAGINTSLNFFSYLHLKVTHTHIYLCTSSRYGCTTI